MGLRRSAMSATGEWPTAASAPPPPHLRLPSLDYHTTTLRLVLRAKEMAGCRCMPELDLQIGALRVIDVRRAITWCFDTLDDTRHDTQKRDADKGC